MTAQTFHVVGPVDLRQHDAVGRTADDRGQIDQRRIVERIDAHPQLVLALPEGTGIEELADLATRRGTVVFGDGVLEVEHHRVGAAAVGLGQRRAVRRDRGRRWLAGEPLTTMKPEEER